MSQPRRSLPNIRLTAMPHPRIASPHGCYYWLIPVPTNLQGWSSREIPPPRPIWQLCRSQSRMLETDRAHTKCMVICLRKKSNYANFVVFRPLRGSLVLYCTKIPRSPPVATWMSNTVPVRAISTNNNTAVALIIIYTNTQR